MDKSSAPPMYSELDTQQAAPGYPAAYPPGYQSYPPSSGYPPQPGYPPQSSYPPQPGYYGQPGYSQPMAYAQQSMQHQNNIVITQQPTSQQVIVAPYKDYMNTAIFVTLCCFWPTGIFAIMRASDARSAMARGDMTAASSYSSSARSMITLSIVLGVLSVVILAIVLGVYYGLLMSMNRIYG